MKPTTALPLLFTIVLMALAGCRPAPAGPTNAPADDTSAAPPEAGYGLAVVSIYAYSGPYVEDGSGEPCENVAAAVIQNDSDRAYEYAVVTVQTEHDTYRFQASTLLPGTVMTVLEAEKKPFQAAKQSSVTVETAAEFAAPPTVHLDTLAISYADGVLNVKNLSEETLRNVTVGYKNEDETGFFGGITYRAKAGDVAPGQTVQIPAPHIRKDSSTVVFADYES